MFRTALRSTLLAGVFLAAGSAQAHDTGHAPKPSLVELRRGQRRRLPDLKRM